MLNNAALDVVIGLIFIYLLYSLLTTVLSEIFATAFKLKALNLREAIGRMLEDVDIKGAIAEDGSNKDSRFVDSMKIVKEVKGSFVNAFYNSPKIVKLGSSGVFELPSSFKPSAFSDTIFSLLGIDGITDKSVLDDPDMTALKNAFAPETARFVKGLWDNSYGDIAKFRRKLEDWFNQTMEQSTEWYKRKIRVVILILGFLMAWFFNASTFKMVKTLSTDDKAREQLVQMATAYIETQQNGGTQQTSRNPETDQLVTSMAREANEIDSTIRYYREKIDTSNAADSLQHAHDTSLSQIDSLERKRSELITRITQLRGSATLDSLTQIRKQLEQDIANANGVMGIGAWPADSVSVRYDSTLKEQIYTPRIDRGGLNRDDKRVINGIIRLDGCKRLGYFFRLLFSNFWGYLLTAFAVSLGAPFWFDLLNKLIGLRTAVKENTKTSGTADSNLVSPDERVG